MQLQKYRYKTNQTFLDYEFISEGPKGKIKKVVRFSAIKTNIYNLGFGDWDESTGEISDTVVTNNNDSSKVLATVAATVNDFTLHYPDALVVVQGSTHSRTRLYRIGLTNNWSLISADFVVYGLINEKWELFQSRRDYTAFLVHRK
ncbi:MAG: hypothetical protein JST86_04715 [Bacteroidetes bacterium]|nr:hypothetical protein [Bacteroidota bacterium]